MELNLCRSPRCFCDWRSVQVAEELLEQERFRSQALANRLRELGIEPDSF